MKTLTLLFALATIFALQTFAYYPPDSCLKISEYDHTELIVHNRDSIKVDSCEGSPTYLQHFAKKYYWLDIEFYSYPFEEVIRYELENRKVASEILDDEKFAVFKIQMLSLEDEFGTFWFESFGIAEYFSDSELKQQPTFRLVFEDYQNLDTIVQRLESFDLVQRAYIEFPLNYNVPIGNVIEGKYDLDTSIFHTTKDALSLLKKELLYKDYQIISIQGIVMEQGKIESNIGIQNLPRGTYIFLIEEQNIFQKFVKM